MAADFNRLSVNAIKGEVSLSLFLSSEHLSVLCVIFIDGGHFYRIMAAALLSGTYPNRSLFS